MSDFQTRQLLETLPNRVCDVVKPWTERLPDHPAIVEGDVTWSYVQLNRAIAETRGWLLESGVRPGDRVMIVCENCRALVAILLSAVSMDAWPVLVNAQLSAREIEQIRDHCGARRVVYATGPSPHATEHAKRFGAVSASVGSLGQISLGPINESTAPEPVEAEIHNRVAAMIYTSGTTGQPKGVMLTHRNLLFIAAVSAKIRSLTSEDRLYGILPMSHAVGLSVVLLGTLLSGATLYLAARFDPMTARTVIERDRLTVILGVPSMFGQFMQYAKLRKLQSLQFPSLRIISSSGAPLDLATKEGTEKLFGMPLHNGYGITECSPTIAQTRVETPCPDISVGQFLPGVEAKFKGPNGEEVATGEVGELWLRGPNIMKGYYRAPEATATAIDSNGWFNTRDLARLEDGNLFVVGRTKELIVRSGFNVYPVEVEAVLNAHSAVARSAVIGRSVSGDEEVLAFVQVSPESQVTAVELAEHAARHLASYKRPSQIVLISAMPLTPTGKVAKNELAKMLPENKETFAISYQ
jgi:long-chain acyl-CoA synthetase